MPIPTCMHIVGMHERMYVRIYVFNYIQRDLPPPSTKISQLDQLRSAIPTDSLLLHISLILIKVSIATFGGKRCVSTPVVEGHQAACSNILKP